MHVVRLGLVAPHVLYDGSGDDEVGGMMYDRGDVPVKRPPGEIFDYQADESSLRRRYVLDGTGAGSNSVAFGTAGEGSWLCFLFNNLCLWWQYLIYSVYYLFDLAV